MKVSAQIVCDPPLSHNTIIPHDKSTVRFTVLLATDEDAGVGDWEVILWHNCWPDGAWEGLRLHPISLTSQGALVSISRAADDERKHFHYSGVVERLSSTNNEPVEFTVKYRRAGRNWAWINDESGASNGSLVFQTSQLPEDLSDQFSKFTTTAKVSSVNSDVESTKLWSVDFEIPGAGKESTIEENLLGIPMYVSRWWALVRQWAAWLTPAHGYGVWKTEKDALVCSFSRRDGLHLVLLGISSIDNVQTLFRDDGFAGVTVRARNDNSEAKSARVLAAIGFNHETALAACMYAARNLVQRGSLDPIGQTYSELHFQEDLTANWYSSWADGIGYCTWNGLGQKLSEQKIFESLRMLRENGVQIQTLIIDDNWQTLSPETTNSHYRTWSEFEANKEGFPQGLASTIAEVRRQNQSIKHIAVWHAIVGYWGGITPDGSIAQKYKTKQVRRMETGHGDGFEAGMTTVVDADHVQSLYSDFYAFLRSCQIDGVKTDDQLLLDLFDDPVDRRSLIRAYQDAWILSGLQNFQDKLISCMSHYPANIFHGLLPSNRPAITLRNSDDFFPEIPESHARHIFVNAHNSLLTKHLNVIPDWDMFQTVHEYASFHAAARCISGGPIYITDEPGKHDFDLIRQMTAETTDGSRVILRPSCVAKAATSSVYTSFHEARLLRTGTYHGRSSNGTSLLGLFNCSEHALLDMIQLHDFRGIHQEQDYIIHSYSTGDVSNILALSSPSSLLSIELPVRGWEILTAHPVSTYSHNDKSIQIVPLGLVDKMSGAAALLDYKIDPQHGQRIYLSITLKAMGTLGVYVSGLQAKSVLDECIITIGDSAIPPSTVSARDDILLVDVEAAWKAVGQSSEWNNEIQLDVFVDW